MPPPVAVAAVAVAVAVQHRQAAHLANPQAASEAMVLPAVMVAHQVP